jgi:protein-S-isoprenylcysteine O-methyltransferase Ste14
MIISGFIIYKQITSFILPVTVIFIVPVWIEKNWKIEFGIHLFMGGVMGLIGLVFMYSTISLFVKVGKGTLAPWAPTKKIVIKGLYRYVRNPMILGVFLMLVSESIVIKSLNISIWAAIFIIINTIYFIFSEEPGLEKRFGNDYKIYKRNVNRWVPRITPFNQAFNEDVLDNNI